MSQSSAYESRNLKWGFEEHQGYDFVENVTVIGDYINSTILSDYLMIAPSHPPIQEEIIRIPKADFQVRWLNDTPASGYEHLGKGLAVPIGNWSVLYQIADERGLFDNQAEWENYKAGKINSNRKWGYKFVFFGDEFSNSTIEIVYVKQDGVLLHYYQEIDFKLTGETTIYNLSRVNVPLETEDFFLDSMDIVVTGIAIVTVIFTLYILHRRRKL